jgi:hypothetical protein
MTYPNGKVEEGNWDGDKFLGKYTPEEKKKLFWFIFKSVIGGIIGAFVFAVLPLIHLPTAIWFGICAVFGIVIGKYTRVWWIGLIGGIVVFFLRNFVGMLKYWIVVRIVRVGSPAELLRLRSWLSLPVAILIGFIFGALIIIIVMKIKEVRK